MIMAREKAVSKFSSSNRVRMKVLSLLDRPSPKLGGLFKNKPIGPREFDMCAEERNGKWSRKKGYEREEILPEEIDGKGTGRERKREIERQRKERERRLSDRMGFY